MPMKKLLTIHYLNKSDIMWPSITITFEFKGSLKDKDECFMQHLTFLAKQIICIQTRFTEKVNFTDLVTYIQSDF